MNKGFLLCSAIFMMISCTKPKVDLSGYTPNQDFTPAFTTLKSHVEKANDKDYDIEATVRAMNSIELAQSQSSDFLGYLEYLSKEDYSKVAPEILETKIKLLPILQKMSELKSRYSELDDIWMLAQCAAAGVNSISNQVSSATTDGVSSLMNVAVDVTATPLLVLKLGNGVSNASAEMFSEYNKAKDLRFDIKKEIDAVRLSYIDYLTEYAPVYHKYMKEFDHLCLKKDKAYLDIYGGRNQDAYNTTKEILKDYPTNREALLLNAIACVNLSYKSSDKDNVLYTLPTQNDSLSNVDGTDKYILEANKTIDKYLELYPSKSAPALVARAMLNFATGNDNQALSNLDQAAIEYPKQAEELTDMLNSYKFRSYLNKTPEGKYLLRLYTSTMEGYGIFSPNFQKATYWEKKGDINKSSKEIFNHFFRRGNQGIYSCLLSDMEYCEKNLENSFKKLLMEHSYIDLNIKPTSDWKFSDKSNEIAVNIKNRSDLQFENVRLFLCIHYTDMYVDEYDVVKSSTINVIKSNESADFDDIKIEYQDKKYSDITRIRAIAMTDDKICWVDAPNYKIEHASKKNTSMEESINNLRRMNFQRIYKMDDSKIKGLLSGIKIPTKESKGLFSSFVGGQKINFELPRILTLLDPVFSINEIQSQSSLTPTKNILAGSNILLEFDKDFEDGMVYPLYIYSDYFDCRVNVKYEAGKAEIVNVEIL